MVSIRMILLLFSIMQTTDKGLLFRTNEELAKALHRQRKLKVALDIGDPISLSGKVLDLIVDENNAWTAESGWQARRVDLTVRHQDFVNLTTERDNAETV